ncbi:MAG: hypothetical protein JG766_93 [Desulfacinum sp.]|nr:hypothetical protein [Desulfacinum sp.]
MPDGKGKQHSLGVVVQTFRTAKKEPVSKACRGHRTQVKPASARYSLRLARCLLPPAVSLFGPGTLGFLHELMVFEVIEYAWTSQP